MSKLIIPNMKTVRKILWFALCFGIGGLIRAVIKSDYHLAGINVTVCMVILGLILLANYWRAGYER